jgi:hypothetical protein
MSYEYIVETADKRNESESYMYSMRDKIDGSLNGDKIDGQLMIDCDKLIDMEEKA